MVTGAAIPVSLKGTCIGFIVRRRRDILSICAFVSLFLLLARVASLIEDSSEFRAELAAGLISPFRIQLPLVGSLVEPLSSDEMMEDGDDGGKNSTKLLDTAGHCVPPSLEHLITNYTAKLCRATRWSGNWSEETKELSCQYPSLNPFDSVVVKHFRQKRSCAPPKYPVRLFDTDGNYLVTLADPRALGYSNCYYITIQRKRGSDTYTLTSRLTHPIESVRQEVPPEHEFIKIVCLPFSGNTSGPKENYMEYLGFVHLKPKVENVLNQIPLAPHSVNVAILGIDSTSRLNFIRTMPKSYEYINEDLEGFGLFGYNKVGEVTFANVVPLLTGMTPGQISVRPNNSCPVHRGPYDKCPFIWNDFVSNGYRTAYAEDATHLATFQYARRGFVNTPTDYYLRPLLRHSDYQFGTSGGDPKKCYAGSKLQTQYLLDYMKSMAITMGDSRRYFGFYFTNSLTHNEISLAKHLDKPLLETLKWFKQSGHLNNTILILLSDHGMRYLGFRHTLQGRFEDRMPFVFFVIPPWFQRQYPKAMQNLRENKYRLSTPFDVHHTLQDLLHLSGITDIEIERRTEKIPATFDQKPRNKDVRHGMSLFLPVPKTRLCSHAGIPDLFCICHKYERLQTSDYIVRSAAHFIVQEINRRIQKLKLCASWSLVRIVNAHKVSNPSQHLKFNRGVSLPKLKGQSAQDSIRLLNGSTVVAVVLVLSPGNAKFEGVVSRHGNGKPRIWGDISRINLYGNQSYCVHSYTDKSFCYCTGFRE